MDIEKFSAEAINFYGTQFKTSPQQCRKVDLRRGPVCSQRSLYAVPIGENNILCN